MKRRVVITGMGVMTSIGKDLDTFFWGSLMEGKSGVSRIESFDVSEYSTQIAAEIKDFNPEDYLDKKKKRAEWTVLSSLPWLQVKWPLRIPV